MPAYTIDEEQRSLNGGSYCFHLDEHGRYCGRAWWWAGHLNSTVHAYIGETGEQLTPPPSEPEGR